MPHVALRKYLSRCSHLSPPPLLRYTDHFVYAILPSFRPPSPSLSISHTLSHSRRSPSLTHSLSPLPIIFFSLPALAACRLQLTGRRRTTRSWREWGEWPAWPPPPSTTGVIQVHLSELHRTALHCTALTCPELNCIKLK